MITFAMKFQVISSAERKGSDDGILNYNLKHLYLKKHGGSPFYVKMNRILTFCMKKIFPMIIATSMRPNEMNRCNYFPEFENAKENAIFYYLPREVQLRIVTGSVICNTR